MLACILESKYSLFAFFNSHSHMRSTRHPLASKIAVISFSFSLPIFLMISGPSITAVMSVPKASVDKYGDPFLEENKIRMPLNGIISSPSRNPVLFKYFYQSEFCGFVLLRLDLPHDGGTFLFVKNIGHNVYFDSNSIRRLGSVSFSRTI